MAVKRGLLFVDPVVAPLSPLNTILPNAKLVFQNSRLSGGGVTGYVPTLYQDAGLTTPFASNTITANAQGQFPVINFPPVGLLRVQLFNQAGQLLGDVDPYVPTGRFDVSAVCSLGQVSLTTIFALPTPQVFVPYPGTYRFKSVTNWQPVGGAPVAVFMAPFFTTLTGVNQALSVINAGAYRDGFESSYVLVGGNNGASLVSGGYMNNLGTERNAPTVILITLAVGNTNQIEISGAFTCTAPGVMALYVGMFAGSTGAQCLPGGYLQVQKLK